MRVTRIPGDFNDIGGRPCRVWCNEQEITDWTVADDFRRVVETPGGVHHGAVRIELAAAPRYVRLAEEDNAEFAAWHDTTTGCLWMAPHGEDPNAEKAIVPSSLPANVEHVPDVAVVDAPAAAARKPHHHIPARKLKAGK